MESFANTIVNLLQLATFNIPLVLMILAGLWLFNILNWSLDSPLNQLGIYPRRLRGLIGIPFSPLLHANGAHLFFNTIPLFILLDFVLLDGVQSAMWVTVWIVLLGGLIVWLIGRPALHIGASGLIMGYWGLMLSRAYYQPSVVSIILAIVMLYYLGSLLLSLFPTDADVSWEAHLAGFLAGLAAGYYQIVVR